MDKKKLVDVVQCFQALGREGGYWDFKKKWYDDKAELLLDIICMANNMEDRDAYIILGIEDHTMKVIGVENDPNRKNLNELSQFVAGKHFAIYTPEIDLQTITLNSHEVDIIIIRNSDHTPYYLETDFHTNSKAVLHGEIYIRLNDRKAGMDTAAPYSCIEYLWKKRFGINRSIMERLYLLLNDIDKWKCDWGNKDYAFHVDYPEFRLQCKGEMQRGWWPSAAFYAHPVMSLSKLNIMYHDTIIYETELWCFDDHRKYLPKATNFEVNGKTDFSYSYYDLSTIEGKLLTIFTNGTNDISSREPDYHQILIFNDAADKKDFDCYLEQHINDFSDDEIRAQYRYQIANDIPENGGGLSYSAFHVAKAAQIYSMWLASKVIVIEKPNIKY